LDVLIEMSLTGVFSYIGRNIIHLIPFPLEGFYGFKHLKVKEVNSGALLTTFLVFFQSNLQLKLTNLVKRDRGIDDNENNKQN
jgi:glycopeptide antibiotics resistance protein